MLKLQIHSKEGNQSYSEVKMCQNYSCLCDVYMKENAQEDFLSVTTCFWGFVCGFVFLSVPPSSVQADA